MDDNWRLKRRQLLIRDSLTFLLLTTGTVVLFAFTLFMFRSFTAHRAELAVRWARRGQVALTAGKPEEAISALQTSLEYAPDVRANQLLLAQALSAAGHTEQATNYFLNLWEAEPGDGTINLQLARLERRRHDKEAAIRYYRAAIYGTWEGDGVVRRRDARLELANYLIDEHDLQTAQIELLIAASNAPSDPSLEIGFGDELLRADDTADALRYYQKAIQQQPRNVRALDKAGRLAFATGEYTKARGWLERAIRDSGGAPGSASKIGEDDVGMLHRTERLLAIAPEFAVADKDRAARLLSDGSLAQQRLNACQSQLQATQQQPAAIAALATQWTATAAADSKKALLNNDVMRDAMTNLIYDTETTTAQLCGPPTGDDALLLLLARSQHGLNGSNQDARPGQEP